MMEQALLAEQAMLNSSSLFGVSSDYDKCFDRVPVHIVLELAVAAGMSPKLVAPLK